ncbi:MAG: MBL fold metallo-hydrolase [Planctomycetes bacterium]|nr:MBL fold metallo-hydrolase [Planctomycetota bacterium]MCB9904513.1 MBL fold metallo-hydrolase [Planctomycetota bacterium]
MRVTPCGAAGEVTGSCYLVETAASRILVDCGLFQGNSHAWEKNGEALPVAERELDAIVLSHAHLDHCGRLPLAVKRGFSRTIHATPATIELIEILLADSAYIQEADARRRNRHAERNHEGSTQALYTITDVEATMPLCKGTPVDETFEVTRDIRARFHRAGHILGATSVELIVSEGDRETTVVFSGDIGPKGIPLLRDSEPPAHADFVFLESTYGSREHRTLDSTIEEFEQILAEAYANRQKLLVPAFAVGRTQQIFFHLTEAFRKRVVPHFPIYLDSPLAIKATEIYQNNAHMFDDEARGLLATGQFREHLSTLELCNTAEESKALNDVAGPCMIIAGAGMCNGGRIVHHLRHNLPDPGTTVLLVGYSATGTRGAQLAMGAKSVRIFGEDVPVNARVVTLGGFSAHAGQSGLVNWFGAMAASKPRLALTHGEPDSCRALADRLRARFGVEPKIPELRQVIEI